MIEVAALRQILKWIEYLNVVIWKAQVEYDRKFSHHEETKITKQDKTYCHFLFVSFVPFVVKSV